MTRPIYPMDVADLSAFAKSLREQIGKLDHKPSHVETLNLLTRAAGFRNYQHFRASRDLQRPSAAIAAEANPVLPASRAEDVPNEARVLKMLRLFDGDGRLLRWPTKRAQQELCLWFLWSRLPAVREFSERQISSVLDGLHHFGDAALLRRDMFDLGLVRRNRDGSGYCRIERAPPPELKLLLTKVESRKRAA